MQSQLSVATEGHIQIVGVSRSDWRRSGVGSSWAITLNLSFFPCNMGVTPNILPTFHMGS